MIPLEKQCVSLELAKRLKELGVSQEGEFYWVSVEELPTPYSPVTVLADFEGEWYLHAEWQLDGLTATKYFAFTVAELGEMLLHHNNAKAIDEWLYGYGRGWLWIHPD